MSRLTRDGTAEMNPSLNTKFSGANGGREIFFFSIRQLTAKSNFVYPRNNHSPLLLVGHDVRENPSSYVQYV